MCVNAVSPQGKLNLGLRVRLHYVDPFGTTPSGNLEPTFFLKKEVGRYYYSPKVIYLVSVQLAAVKL